MEIRRGIGTKFDGAGVNQAYLQRHVCLVSTRTVTSVCTFHDFITWKNSKVTASCLLIERAKFAPASIHHCVSWSLLRRKKKEPRSVPTLMIYCRIWWKIVMICSETMLFSKGHRADMPNEHVAKDWLTLARRALHGRKWTYSIKSRTSWRLAFQSHFY